MGAWWPWFAVAGLGALHGLHPASGWMWAAAWGLRSRDAAAAWRALLPIAIGHAASLGLVALAFAAGASPRCCCTCGATGRSAHPPATRAWRCGPS